MILVVNDYDGRYAQFWGHLGRVTTNINRLFRAPQSVRLVCFTGGEDISPALYGHQNLGSHCSRTRDEKEVLIFEMARKHRIPMTGICRGSQFLNVMCGGTMIQDLRRTHGGPRHRCLTYDGQSFEVTSSHHQMSVPGPEGRVLAWDEQGLGIEDCLYDGELPESILDFDPEILKEDGEPMVRVTEAFVYPKHRIFACQHHPEWQMAEVEAPQWTLRKIREFCWGEGELTMEAS